MFQSWANEFQDSQWQGEAELWLDPGGNKADTSECILVIESGILSYTWTYEGAIKAGSFTFQEDGATWTDSWHQPDPVKCKPVTGAWGLFTVEYSYSVPSGPDWGWRSKLSQRPDGSLVLQMTNIAPWGEESRAMRMICQKVSSNA